MGCRGKPDACDLWREIENKTVGRLSLECADAEDTRSYEDEHAPDYANARLIGLAVSDNCLEPPT